MVNIVAKVTTVCICHSIKRVNYIKYLGIILHCKLNWKEHISLVNVKIINVLCSIAVWEKRYSSFGKGGGVKKSAELILVVYIVGIKTR